MLPACLSWIQPKILDTHRHSGSPDKEAPQLQPDSTSQPAQTYIRVRLALIPSPQLPQQEKLDERSANTVPWDGSLQGALQQLAAAAAGVSTSQRRELPRASLASGVNHGHHGLLFDIDATSAAGHRDRDSRLRRHGRRRGRGRRAGAAGYHPGELICSFLVSGSCVCYSPPATQPDRASVRDSAQWDDDSWLEERRLREPKSYLLSHHSVLVVLSSADQALRAREAVRLNTTQRHSWCAPSPPDGEKAR